ncbi:glutamate receptor ionotropic, delta-2-like [Periplaneta americana]|uniref:glutamate receptor ionotropic, delta-2-like n=1 Tax=Periplaneta americana TaxID=6978 RepID=UPI0037E81C47
MRKKISVIWLCISYVHGNLMTSMDVDSERINESIGHMTRNIVTKYFAQDYCVGVITENGEILKYTSSIIPISLLTVYEVPEMVKEEGRTRNETKRFEEIMIQLLNQGCLSFIIQVTDSKNIIQYFYKLSRRSTTRSNRRYLYLPFCKNAEIQNPDARRIFEMKEMHVMPDLVLGVLLKMKEKSFSNCMPNSNNTSDNDRIRNVTYDCSATKQESDWTDEKKDCGKDLEPKRKNIQMEKVNLKDICTNHTIELVTHTFVGPNSEAEVWLDRWVDGNGFVKDENLYKNKMKNLHGKMVSVAATPNYPPYTIIDTNRTPFLYDGIELRFVKEFARHLNFTFSVLTDDVGWWGEVWENETGNGMWGNVALDNAIMGFGATYAWLENYPYLDYSLPYFRSSVRCLIPKPRQLPGWMTPILPFNSVMWEAVGISLVITVVSLYMVTKGIVLLTGFSDQRFSTVADSVIRSIGLLLLQAPSEDRSPEFVALRHLLAWLLVFFLLVNSIYSGGLSSVLTVPRFEHPINTVAELAKSEILWAATTEAWVYSILEATEPDLAHVTRNYRVLSEEQLLGHAFKEDMAFAVERLLGGNYAMPSYVNDKTVVNLRAMRDDLYSGHCVFNVRKASPFMESLNTLVLRMHAAGLLLYSERQPPPLPAAAAISAAGVAATTATVAADTTADVPLPSPPPLPPPLSM